MLKSVSIAYNLLNLSFENIQVLNTSWLKSLKND